MTGARFVPILILLALGAPAARPQRPENPASKHGGTYMFSYYLPQTPTATPSCPAWSPDGRWRAVSMYGSIWKVDPRNAVSYDPTSNPTLLSPPTSSPAD